MALLIFLKFKRGRQSLPLSKILKNNFSEFSEKTSDLMSENF